MNINAPIYLDLKRIDPLSKSEKQPGGTLFIEVFKNGVDLIVNPEGGTTAEHKDLGFKAIPIPLSLPKGSYASADYLFRGKVIANVQTSILYLNVHIDKELMDVETLVHLIRCSCDGTFEKRGDSHQWLMKRDLISIGERVIERFNGSKKSEEMIDELVTLSCCVELSEKVIVALNPFLEVHDNENRLDLALLEGRSKAIQNAPFVNANTLYQYLKDAIDQLSQRLRASASAEAREELIALFIYTAAIVDQLVDQEVLVFVEGEFADILNKIERFKADYGLGDRWFTDKIKKLMRKRAVTRDNDILFLANYVQQGLLHLKRSKSLFEKVKKRAPSLIKIVTALGVSIGAAVTTSGISLAVEGSLLLLVSIGKIVKGSVDVLKAGAEGSVKLIELVSDDKKNYGWYSSFRELIILMRIYLTGGDPYNRGIKQCLEYAKGHSMDKTSDVDETREIGSEGQSYLIYGIIDVLGVHFKREHSKNALLTVEFLAEILNSHMGKGRTVAWVGDRAKVFNKAYVTLHDIYFKLTDKDEALKKIAAEALGRNFEKGGIWEEIPGIEHYQHTIPKTIGDLSVNMYSWDPVTNPVKWYDHFDEFWQKLLHDTFSQEQKNFIGSFHANYENLTLTLKDKITEDPSFVNTLFEGCAIELVQFLQGFNRQVTSKDACSASLALLSSLYQKFTNENDQLRINIQKAMQDLYFLSEIDETNVFEGILGRNCFRWLRNLSIISNKKTLNDTIIKKIRQYLEEAPWLNSKNPTVAELYWNPVGSLIDRLLKQYNKKEAPRSEINSLLMLILDHAPNHSQISFEMKILNHLHKHARRLDDEQKMIYLDQTEESKTTSTLTKEVSQEQFKYQLDVKDRWSKTKAYIVHKEGNFPKVKIEKNRKTYEKDITELFDTFMNDDSKSVMILKGEPGSGKTTIMEYLAYSTLTESKKEMKSKIPVFVSLSEIEEPNGKLFEQIFKSDLDHLPQWKKEKEFVFFLDGYDELQERVSLYHNNQMYQWEKSKFIFACRTHLEGHSDVESLLAPRSVIGKIEDKSYLSYTLTRFSENQRNDYIKHFVNEKLKSELNDEEIKFKQEKYLEMVKTEKYSLQTISRNPFMLRALIEILPRFFDRKNAISRTEIYNKFIFLRLKEDLDRAERTLGKRVTEEELYYFCKVLALFMLKSGDGIFDARRDLKLDPDSPFAGPEAIGYLLPKVKEYTDFQNLASMIIPAGGADRYKYMHRTIYEYFAACAFIDSLRKAPSTMTHAHDITPLPINYMAMQSASEELRFFKEMIDDLELEDANEREEEKTKWVQILFSIIRMQQKLKAEEEIPGQELKIKNAVSNALTILNLLGVSFSGCDLSNLYAPGACLVNATLNGANTKKSIFGQMDRGVAEWELSRAEKLERITNIDPFYTEDGEQTWILVSGMIAYVEDGEKIGENGIFYLYSLDKNGQSLTSKFRAGETGTDECTIVDPNNYVIDSEHRKLYFVGHNSNSEPAEIQVREFKGPKAHYFANYADKSKDNLSWDDGKLKLGSSVGGKIDSLPVIKKGDEDTAKAYSYDRKWLAIGKANGIVEIWKVDAEDGQRRLVCMGKLQQTPITALNFMPDDQSILVGDNEEKLIHRWDFQTLVDPTFNRVFEHRVDQVSLHEDEGLRLKTVDGEVFRWEIMQQHYVSPEEVEEKFAKNKFKEVDDKRRVFGKTVKNKDADTRLKELSEQQVAQYKKALLEKIKKGPYKGHALNLRNKRVNIDLEAVSKSIAVMSCDHVLMFMYGENDWIRKATVHPAPVNDIIISDDEQTLITKSTDGTVVVWKLDKKAEQFNILHKLTNTPFFINPELDK